MRLCSKFQEKNIEKCRRKTKKGPIFVLSYQDRTKIGTASWFDKEKIESGALFITLLTFRTSRKIYEGLKHKSNHICYIQTALSPLDTGIMFSALDTTFLDNRFLRFKNILALDNLFSLWVKYFALDNIFSCKITGISRWITCFHVGVHLFRAGKHVFTLKYTFSALENMFLRWTT